MLLVDNLECSDWEYIMLHASNFEWESEETGGVVKPVLTMHARELQM